MHLSSRDRDTVDRILGEPPSRNIEWREVVRCWRRSSQPRAGSSESDAPATRRLRVDVVFDVSEASRRDAPMHGSGLPECGLATASDDSPPSERDLDGMPLLDRRDELDRLGRLLDTVRKGLSETLVIRGEPGPRARSRARRSARKPA